MANPGPLGTGIVVFGVGDSAILASPLPIGGRGMEARMADAPDLAAMEPLLIPYPASLVRTGGWVQPGLGHGWKVDYQTRMDGPPGSYRLEIADNTGFERASL